MRKTASVLDVIYTERSPNVRPFQRRQSRITARLYARGYRLRLNFLSDVKPC